MDSRTGVLLTATQSESGVCIWTVNNPLYFKITGHLDRPFKKNNDIMALQSQFIQNLRKALGIHNCLVVCQLWTRLHPRTSRFLRIYRYQCRLRVISFSCSCNSGAFIHCVPIISIRNSMLIMLLKTMV
uniref:Replication enhancer n=1 Tax=Squash leaf curl Yunnan virus TaxID=222474 RepID=A0A1P8NNM0_9GEMI|nr:AC3 [Squash leaf curl Yunnan virus]QKX94851.1 replication enhancer protein [Squash leaf curl Yunnan virus]